MGRIAKGNDMNFRILFLLLVLPLSLHAEIYKWKDSNGVVRYSDQPPVANVPYESMGSKKPTAPPQTQPADKVEQTKPAGDKPAGDKADKQKSSTDTDAAKRQKSAEDSKKKEQDKEAELKLKQQNCANAKANVQVFKQGGLITKTIENGERVYMSDADIASGLAQAQQDVEKYCEGE